MKLDVLFLLVGSSSLKKKIKPEVDGTNESTRKYVCKNNDDFLLFSRVLLAIMDY